MPGMMKNQPMKDSYVKGLEKSVAGKAYKPNPGIYGPKGNYPGKNINAYSAAKRGEKVSDVLIRRATKNVDSATSKNRFANKMARHGTYVDMSIANKYGKQALRSATKADRQMRRATTLKNAGL